MYVNNVRLYAKHLRLDLAASRDGLPEAARDRLLLQGPNGSGKSTVLQTISTLWGFFGRWIEIGQDGRPPTTQMRHVLADGDLAAVEFRGFAGNLQSLWVAMGKANAVEDLRREYPDSVFAAALNFGEGGTTQGKWSITLPSFDLRTIRDQSLVGRVPQPNVVYFPPEDRTIRPQANGPAKLLDTTEWNWSASFESRLDFDSLLVTARAHQPERYEEAIRLVNQILKRRNKWIVPVGPSGRHLVERKIEGLPVPPHRIEYLSSGEKQLLVFFGFLACTLRPGGIVLIDEPDLHIHLSMIRSLLDSIALVVRERQGQLIVASHSQPVSSWFSREAERVQLGKWSGE